MVDRAPIAVGLVLGVAVPSVVYADGYWDPQLMAVLGLTWTVSGWLMARNWRTMREAPERWGALYALLVIGVPQFGIHADLPLSGDLWDVLRLLVIGGLAGAVALGIEMARPESHREESRVTTPAD